MPIVSGPYVDMGMGGKVTETLPPFFMPNNKGESMKALSGKTSDRIRSGEIPPDAVGGRIETNDTPSADAVRHAEGHMQSPSASRHSGGSNA
jgi:hypothetical protein